MVNEFDASFIFVGNDDNIFYFLTDLDAPNLRVIAIDVNNPDRSEWQEVIAESTDVIEAVSLVFTRFVASYLHDAHSQVKVFDLEGQLIHQVDLSGLETVHGFNGRRDDPETFFLFNSFTIPESIYHYDVTTSQRAVFRQPEVRFDPEDCTT